MRIEKIKSIRRIDEAGASPMEIVTYGFMANGEAHILGSIYFGQFQAADATKQAKRLDQLIDWMVAKSDEEGR